MERVIIIKGTYDLSNNDTRELNEWLARGWKVKTVVTETVREYITAIFVLQKDN